MKKIFLILCGLSLAACTPAMTNQNNNLNMTGNVNSNVNINTNTNTSATPTPSVTATPNVPAGDLVPYTNKAVGYSISIPKNWYWQHYVAGSYPTYKDEDVLLIDGRKLEGIVTSDAPAQLVVRASTRADMYTSICSNKNLVDLGSVRASQCVSDGVTHYVFTKNAYTVLVSIQSGPAATELMQDILKTLQ